MLQSTNDPHGNVNPTRRSFPLGLAGTALPHLAGAHIPVCGNPIVYKAPGQLRPLLHKPHLIILSAALSLYHTLSSAILSITSSAPPPFARHTMTSPTSTSTPSINEPVAEFNLFDLRLVTHCELAEKHDLIRSQQFNNLEEVSDMDPCCKISTKISLYSFPSS